MSGAHGRVVVISGGAGGIGAALGEEFLSRGDRVVLTDIAPAGLESVRERLNGEGREVYAYPLDVCDRGAVGALASELESRFGGVDVLVNNAGIGHHGMLAETSVDKWRRLLEVNLFGVLHHVDAFLPAMRRRGTGVIANVSSGQAFFRLPTWGAYAAVKAALGVYSEVLHYEVRPAGVHVCTIYPFMVDTGFYEEVEGRSLGARLSMKLVPYYSMSARRVARKIAEAVDRRRRLEIITPINRVAALACAMPVLPALIGRGANWFLADGGKEDEAKAL
jgi:NAD(P)-dependent dehydrogenase (short-subunit alcohol dehydrogenase family)